MHDKTSSIPRSGWSRRSLLVGSGAFLATATFVRPATAQAFPSKPIRLFVGFAPGGLSDALARVVAPVLAEKIKQPVIVESRPGAAGTVALDLVARAPKDGYTLLFSSIGQIVVTPHTNRDLATNPITELEHVSMIGDGNLIVVINAEVPVTTFAEFVALAKREPGQLAYGDNGAGSNGHVTTELMKLRTGIDLKPVHYRGIGALMPDLLSNQVQLAILSPTQTIESHVADKKLRVLLVVGPIREPMFPTVPTAIEAGIKDLDRCTNWFGINAPKDTPADVIAVLQTAIAETMASPSIQERFRANNVIPMAPGPEAFKKRIEGDDELFRDVVAATQIKVE